MDIQQILSRSNPHLYETKVCRATTQVSTELDGETVILDVSAGIYSGLDPVGTAIWNLFEAPISIAQLLETILKTYDVSEEQCVDDMLIFLKDLAKNKLIDISDGTVA